MRTDLESMKKLSRTQLEIELARLQDQRNHLMDCLAAFMSAYQALGGELTDELDEWAYRNGNDEKANLTELWLKALKDEPRNPTEYVLSRRDMEARLIQLEDVMTESHEKLAEKFSAMKEEVRSAHFSRGYWERRWHSIWLLAKGMPQPWGHFIMQIFSNGKPSTWESGSEFFVESPFYPGWEWKDKREVYPYPFSHFTTPQAEERADKIRKLRMQAVKIETQLACLEWQERLSEYKKKTEAEIEEMTRTIWNGVIDGNKDDVFLKFINAALTVVDCADDFADRKEEDEKYYEEKWERSIAECEAIVEAFPEKDARTIEQKIMGNILFFLDEQRYERAKGLLIAAETIYDFLAKGENL